MDFRFIRPIADGCAFPTGIVDMDTGLELKEGASILEIMDFLRSTTAPKVEEG